MIVFKDGADNPGAKAGSGSLHVYTSAQLYRKGFLGILALREPPSLRSHGVETRRTKLSEVWAACGNFGSLVRSLGFAAASGASCSSILLYPV